MRRRLKRKFKNYIERNYYSLCNKKYFPILDKIYYSFFLDDIAFLKKEYQLSFKKELNLDQPKTFNEKIIWLNLNNNQSRRTLCTDKLEVREYIKNSIGEEYLIPLLFSTNNYKDLHPEKLPAPPYILKTNHDSGNYEIIKEKDKVNYSIIREKFKKALNTNYYYFWRERQYKNIKPYVVAEALLQPKNGKVPYDYKFHCTKGDILFIQVDVDRGEDHTRPIYDKNWKELPFQKDMDKGKGVNPPKNLLKMITLAEKLSQEFIYVRVDLYEVDGKIYFGELTFTPGAGLSRFNPEKWDAIIGEKININ